MQFLIPFFGYLASVLLAISLLVNNDLKFRWINTGGCLSFIFYGVFLGAFPIILTNSILLLINLFYLVKIYRTEEDFDMIEFTNGGPLLHKFFKFYKEDITSYFPDYIQSSKESNIQFVVLRDMVIANVFVADLQDNGTAIIRINYTVPKYRDYKVGRYIFDNERKFLTSKGVKEIVYNEVKNDQHKKFLKKMGFINMGQQFKKELI